jgi:hypothetical protein
MIEILDGFTECVDCSAIGIHACRFTVDGGPIYVLWNDAKTDRAVDASTILGSGKVLVTRIVTELDENQEPIVVPPQVCPSTAVPLSLTPIFAAPQ